MNLNIKNKIVLGSCLSLVLVTILAIFANQSIKSLVETSTWVEHTHQVLDHASRIEKLIVDMETGERGFLITGKEEFLEPYELGNQLLSKVLSKTKSLVSDNPAQIERLDEIEKAINLWQAKAGIPEIEKRKEVTRNFKAISNLEMLAARTVGKEIFDNIRYEINVIRSEFDQEKNFRGKIILLDVFNSLLDMETGQRGFLLTGKEESLSPYTKGQKAFEGKIEKLNNFSENVKGRRIIKQSIDHIKLLVSQWLEKAANPEIKARQMIDQRSSKMSDVTSLIEKGTGKRIIDDLRTKLLIFKQTEHEVMAVRKVEAEHRVSFAKSVIIFGTLMVLFISLFGSFWLAGSISKPINLLKLASVGVGKGIYPDKLYIDSKDEVADLGNAFENMVGKIKSNEKAILLKIEEAESAKEEPDKSRAVAEIATKEADKANKAKSIFLANMSHEIRTPMNAVLGYAQILQRDSSLSEVQYEAIQTINKSGNHLLELINDILDISKIEAGKQELNKTVFDLGVLTKELKSIFSGQCKEKQLVFEMEECPEGKILVNGDLGKLKQVLINLIGNAVKFTDSGSVGCRFSKQEFDNQFLFEVTDTEVGIPKDSQESIFEPFMQEEEGFNKGGTGLGLAICRKQVNQMGGELQIDSEPGKGSRFYFSILLDRRSRTKPTENADTKYDNIIGLKDEFKIKALVVDDIKENRDVLTAFLRSIGVVVTNAENGKVALEQVEQVEPHIIFMDIRMPVMDGVEALHKIKEKYPQNIIKIICITASTLRDQQQKYLDIGFDSYISKPFNHSDIFEVLEKDLNVEYNYKENGRNSTAQEIPDDFDWSNVKIPPEIKTLILNAADSHSITGLEKSYEHLKSIENGGKELASLLKQFLNSYDMEGIKNTMNKIS